MLFAQTAIDSPSPVNQPSGEMPQKKASYRGLLKTILRLDFDAYYLYRITEARFIGLLWLLFDD